MHTIRTCVFACFSDFPDNEVHGANMGPMWGRQDPGGPHVGPMNKTIHWLITLSENSNKRRSWLYVTKLYA